MTNRVRMHQLKMAAMGSTQEPNGQTVTKSVPMEPGMIGEREIITPTARILYRVKSVLPPDWAFLRANELIIDELKVNFVYHYFIFSEQVKSHLIKDIKSVVVETNPFFAAIKVYTGSSIREEVNYSEEAKQVEIKKVRPAPEQISFLRVEEAKKARRIIEGLLILDQQKMNTAKLQLPEVVSKAEELGRAR